MAKCKELIMLKLGHIMNKRFRDNFEKTKANRSGLTETKIIELAEMYTRAKFAERNDKGIPIYNADRVEEWGKNLQYELRYLQPETAQTLLNLVDDSPEDAVEMMMNISKGQPRDFANTRQRGRAKHVTGCDPWALS